MIKNCEMCGGEYETKNVRAKYCESCRKKKQIERNRTYAEKRKSGTARSIGSVQTCPICHEEYILKTGSQKCCDNCRGRQQYLRQSKQPQKPAKEYYDTYLLYLEKDSKNGLMEFAKSNGMSLNEFINTAISQLVEKIKNER